MKGWAVGFTGERRELCSWFHLKGGEVGSRVHWRGGGLGREEEWVIWLTQEKNGLGSWFHSKGEGLGNGVHWRGGLGSWFHSKGGGGVGSRVH